MYCPKCGVKIEDNSRFCSNCGAQIGKQIPQQPKNRKTSGLHSITGSLKSFFSKNIYRIIAIISLAALILIFVYTCIISIRKTHSGLASLNGPAAALGTVLFMLCCIVPAFLSLQAIRSLLLPVQAMGQPPLPANDRPVRISKTTYFQIISFLLVCITIIVLSFLYDMQAKNDMGVALQYAFTSYRISAIIGIALGILATVILSVSRKKAVPSESSAGTAR